MKSVHFQVDILIMDHPLITKVQYNYVIMINVLKMLYFEIKNSSRGHYDF